MLITLSGLLSQAQLQTVRRLIAEARFVDGKLSAGKEAQPIKNNREMAQDQELYNKLNGIVMIALLNHPEYQRAALPLRVASPFYAKYGPGMTYGDHIDDPVMGPPGQRYRSDVSTTIFLSEAEDYDGGEIVIRTAFGERKVKLPAGDAVVYPSSSLHHVAEVTRGERLVAVTWAQSMIRDPARRELLYELSQARESLLDEAPEKDSTRLVSNAYSNLVRMWAEV
ncbi:Fe2+-dependent dioxygenase [Thiohalobacter sp. IOR34]|uniref:Fe2+-dependent dioxygenase n=1 Tax=Thiohalobacter sp. IOR34 TaxID=3057176 RepID=UPI0025AF001F|nr:Fe2+-dependent dioxygenase [Thiohalobacter sp. IOR34]WJW74335.1 Fe2+-dependent dioxygenase [Thiohalobacter sp. IOR34]